MYSRTIMSSTNKLAHFVYKGNVRQAQRIKVFECCHLLSSLVVGDDFGPGIAEKRMPQDVIIVRMGIDQKK